MQTTLKLPLHQVVHHAATSRTINNIVGPVNRLVGLTYFVLRLYFESLLNRNLEVPPVDEPLVRYAMWTVTEEYRPVHTDVAIRTEMINLIPLNLRHSISLPTGSSQIMTLERGKMVTCMKVAVQQHFVSNRRCFVNRTLRRGRYKLNKDVISIILMFYIIHYTL
jgi:hypothetical protein